MFEKGKINKKSFFKLATNSTYKTYKNILTHHLEAGGCDDRQLPSLVALVVQHFIRPYEY